MCVLHELDGCLFLVVGFVLLLLRYYGSVVVVVVVGVVGVVFLF